MYKEQTYRDECELIKSAILDLVANQIDSSEQFLQEISQQLDEWQSKMTLYVREYSGGNKVMVISDMKIDKQGVGKESQFFLCHKTSFSFVVDHRKGLSVHEIRHGKKALGFSKLRSAMKVNRGKSVRNVCKNHQCSNHDLLSFKDYRTNILGSDHMGDINFILETFGRMAQFSSKSALLHDNLLKEVGGKLHRIRFLLRKNAVRYLQSWLDPDILSLVRKSKNWNLNSYNWALGNTAQQSDYRMGALQSYPGLGSIFTKKSDSQGVKLTQQIDTGKSISECLVGVFGECVKSQLHTKTFKRLHGQNRHNLGTEGVNAVRNNVYILSLFSSEDIPQSSLQWKEFNEFSELLKLIEKKLWKCVSDVVQREKIDMGDLDVMGIRFDGGRGNGSGKLNNAYDFVDAIFKYAVLPQIAQHAGVDSSFRVVGGREKAAIMQRVLSTVTLKQIIKGSDRWHDRVGTFYARMESLGVANGSSWAPLTEKFTSSNGVVFEPLTTKWALKSEGDRMNHCVGGYSSSCINGTSHIYHLSYKENGKTYRSTLHLEEESAEDGKCPLLRFRANNAEWNHSPNSEISRAVDKFIEGLNSGEVRVDWAYVRNTREKVRKEYNKNRWVSELGFDPFDDKACEQAFEILKEHCFGAMSKMNLNEWLETTGIYQAIDGAYPSQQERRGISEYAVLRACPV